jgi:hypothetical protein
VEVNYFLEIKKKFIFFVGKKTDMANYLMNHVTASVIVFDLARTNDTGVHAPCVSLAENILDNSVINYKYNTEAVEFLHVPKVIFLANVQPDYSLLSMDRWKVYELPSYTDKNKTVEKMTTFNINFTN